MKIISKIIILAISILCLGCNTVYEVSDLRETLETECENKDKKLDTSNKEALQSLNQRTFDWGAGFGFICNTRHTHDDDARGTMLIFKAYPFGRWYNYISPEQVKSKYNIDVPEYLQNRTYFNPVYKKSENNKGGKEVTDEIDLIATFMRRVSGFYGVSLGNFTGGGIDSTINALGVSVDLTPELAVYAGWAIFDVEENGHSDADGGVIVGLALNTDAFRKVGAAASKSIDEFFKELDK